jgi:crotonobetainyl-CoA:carnitine CoA-transferase CaiB-like acyl-CoA transferase
MTARDHGTLPLAGVRVLEYAQYVAGPFAGMLLSDLGADVIKVEPPDGDAWRRYEPFAPGESRYFYGLNRSKRSVVIDLKTEEGVRASAGLIRSADAVLHNFPADRARRFGLDREGVRECNPDAVWCCVSALGSDGPQASLTAFDLVAQAMSGLLLASAQDRDTPPQRAGGIAIADFTAGLLAAMAVLAGLVGRARVGAPGNETAGNGAAAPGHEPPAPGIEVSLLGAALAVQAQRFVSVDGVDPAPPRAALDRLPPATEADLMRLLDARHAVDELEPYYRSYRARDGYFVLACLHERQRRAAAAILGLDDPWAANPQAPPADLAERERRLELVEKFERRLALEPAADWVRRFRDVGVPAAQVQRLDQLFEHEQVAANGLVATVDGGAGAVRLLGSVFKVDDCSAVPGGIPDLGEHTEEVLSECTARRS